MELDGVLFRRWGGVIAIDGKAYKVTGGSSFARFFFRKLTMAGL